MKPCVKILSAWPCFSSMRLEYLLPLCYRLGHEIFPPGLDDLRNINVIVQGTLD